MLFLIQNRVLFGIIIVLATCSVENELAKEQAKVDFAPLIFENCLLIDSLVLLLWE